MTCCCNAGAPSPRPRLPADVPLPTGPLMGHTLTLFHGLPACQLHGCLLLLGGTRLCSRLGLPTADQAAPDQWNTDAWALPLSGSPARNLQQAWLRVDAPAAAVAPRAFHTATAVRTPGAPGCAAAAASPSPACQALVVAGGLQPARGGVAGGAQPLALGADVLTLRWANDSSGGGSGGNATLALASPAATLPLPLFGHSAVAVQGEGGSGVEALYVVGGLRNWPAGASLESMRDEDVRRLANGYAVRCARATAAAAGDGWACAPDVADGAAVPADNATASALQVRGGTRAPLPSPWLLLLPPNVAEVSRCAHADQGAGWRVQMRAGGVERVGGAAGRRGGPPGRRRVDAPVCVDVWRSACDAGLNAGRAVGLRRPGQALAHAGAASASPRPCVPPCQRSECCPPAPAACWQARWGHAASAAGAGPRPLAVCFVSKRAGFLAGALRRWRMRRLRTPPCPAAATRPRCRRLPFWWARRAPTGPPPSPRCRPPPPRSPPRCRRRRRSCCLAAGRRRPRRAR